MSILILVVFMSLSISGMCSLFEAVLYSTRIGALEAIKAKDKKKSLANKLLSMKKEISVPIASILILNTIILMFNQHKICNNLWINWE